ncbi:hypothetical protein GCM10009733_020370 [Nonomuraea maheshkhaliensis]|uniref:Uncharacterized protein n=1 Tax=Nonomuraea maheshkhaliensis TaxID=419590 RepID=A0ABP4QVD1_9ACTN
MQLFSLEIVHGEKPIGRVRFGDADCPIVAGDLPDKVLGWMAGHGAFGSALDIHVLVTPYGQKPTGQGPICARTSEARLAAVLR